MTASAAAPPSTARARLGGLRYSADGESGIRRKRAGRGFTYVAPDGKTADEFVGFQSAASWNITSALQPGANQITVQCDRRDLNEIGTGGIMGPTVIFRDH